MTLYFKDNLRVILNKYDTFEIQELVRYKNTQTQEYEYRWTFRRNYNNLENIVYYLVISSPEIKEEKLDDARLIVQTLKDIYADIKLNFKLPEQEQIVETPKQRIGKKLTDEHKAKLKAGRQKKVK